MKALRVAVAAAAVSAAGCQRAPAAFPSLAFASDAAPPRVLVSHHEITVPLTLVNTGQREWAPDNIHLSYHWLWFVPREFARPSRTVPYHDGIRTELSAAVPPGGHLSLEGRLLAPTVPGLYWLQWDMVEEGVTWFAQVAPRQPRHLVVVLPTLAGFFAPIPLLVVVAGLIVLRRLRSGLPLGRFAVVLSADVIWCVTSLFSKQLILFHDVLLEPTSVAYWLALVSSVVPPVVLTVLFPRRARGVALVVVGAFGALLILADVVYYRFFGDVLSAPALLAAHQTSQVVSSISSLFTPDLIWLVIDIPVAAWLVVVLSRPTGDWRLATDDSRLRALAAATCLVLVTATGAAMPRVLARTPLDQMFRDRSVVEQLGPFGFHAYDAWIYVRTTWLRPPLTDAQVDDAAAWLAARAPLRAGGPPFFGAARDKNLIVIQVESLQDFVVDFRVADQEVMPNLRRWKNDTVRFTNVTDQTNEGRTSDAEFVAFTSLLPTDHGAAAFRYASNQYVGLPRILTEHRYTTLSAVAFEAGFWNRRVMHPSYGFQQSLFEPDFVLTDQIGWGLNDHEFLQQMLPTLEKLPHPFCAWLITLSLHHPFADFPARHKVLKLGKLDQTPFGNYLHTMRFFDQALEDFKTALVKDRLLDDSVLVVFGDHDAGFPRDAAQAALMGIRPDEIAWTLSDRVPLFVRIPGVFEGIGERGEVVRTPAGQTDFAPTLLGLLGIDASGLPYLGRNLLGAPDNPPVVRPYGDWLDRAHLFFSHGPADQPAVCYELASRTVVSEDRCRTADEAARKARDISRLVIAEDLQPRLRVRLAHLVQ